LAQTALARASISATSVLYFIYVVVCWGILVLIRTPLPPADLVGRGSIKQRTSIQGLPSEELPRPALETSMVTL
jgi:hypothetical protein